MTTTVFFCDLCNESVPHTDLDTGNAFIRKGRVVCATCDRLMGGVATRGVGIEGAAATGGASPADFGGSSPPIGRRASRQGSLGGAAVGFLAVVIAVGVYWKLNGDIGALGKDVDDDLDQQAWAIQLATDDASVGISELSKGYDALRSELIERMDARERAAEKAGDAARQERADMLGELGAFRVELENMGEHVGLIRRHDAEMIGLQAKITELSGDLHAMVDRLAELEARPIAVVSEAGGGVLEEELGGNQPAWANLLKGLTSPNPDERWMAVDELGQTGDARVAPHIVPLLADEDTFVRMATARILGDLQAAEGVGALIDALEDREPAVREAAMVALHSITGRDFKFDPYGTPAERTKKVKAWRQWWLKAEADFEG